LGGRIAQMTDHELAEVATRTTVFAKLNPAHKERVVRALHARFARYGNRLNCQRSWKPPSSIRFPAR